MALIYRRLVSVPKLMYCSIKTNSFHFSIRVKNFDDFREKEVENYEKKEFKQLSY